MSELKNELTELGLPPSENPEYIIDYRGIMDILPHRYPFLYVDGIISIELKKQIVGVKNFTFNEHFFPGHFPKEPVVPGVIQIEALAQVACLLVAVSFEETKGKRPAFAGIDAAKFKKPVRPGDVLTLKAELINFRRNFAQLSTQALLRGEVVTEAIIKAVMV